MDFKVLLCTDSIYGALDNYHDHPGAGKNDIPIDHEHEYKGRKKIMMHYSLRKGEKVVLIRQAGGQLYYILDRIDDPIVEGEWI